MSYPEHAPLAIGVDVGGTKIAAAIVDRQGKVLDERRASTNAASGPAAVISRIADIVQELVESAPEPVAGIGVGTPGYVDPVAGVVTNAVNLGWEQVRLVAELRAHLGDERPIWAENDANVMALGESYYGAAAGCSDFVYVSIGTGLGSGLVVDHKLVSGADFRAAELGHLSLDPDGRLCACGLYGCVETVVSGPGILATAVELVTVGSPSPLAGRPDLAPEDVLLAATEGDPLALSVFEYTGAWLGQALAACVALLNPQRIIVGGGVGLAAFDLLMPGVQLELPRRVLRLSYANLQIVRSQVHSTAVGASSLVWHADNARHAA